MKLAFASMFALLLLFAGQTPATAASATAFVQKPIFGQAQAAVDKVRWRSGWGYRGGWGGYGYRGYRPWGGHYGYGYYPPVYGYYYRPYPYWGGLGWGYGGWGHRRWHRHW
jgi:hypothetical protein